MIKPPLRIRARRLAHAVTVGPPKGATSGAAGIDLRAAIERPVTLSPGERRLVPTGWVLEIPGGWEGQVRPRSGLAMKFGLTVANAPGTIDSDYRGEVGVLLFNLGSEDVVIERGDRVAQLVIAPVVTVEIEVVGELSETARGSGGFGSSGQ